MKELVELKVKDIKRGFVHEKGEIDSCICTVCGREFTEGEVYKIGEHFYDYKRGMKEHVCAEHGDRFQMLLDQDSKYLALTDNQKQLLTLISLGLSDNDIAKELQISSSTVRHQRFMFREKAKQAKMFLAVYELAEENNKDRDKKGKDKLIPIHSKATMVDDRYITTEEERDKILETAFTTLDPPKLAHFPAKEKKKIVVLKKITESFQAGRSYEEKELNEILKSIYSDFPTLRRYLIEYGFMSRTADCKEYRIT